MIECFTIGDIKILEGPVGQEMVIDDARKLINYREHLGCRSAEAF